MLDVVSFLETGYQSAFRNDMSELTAAQNTDPFQQVDILSPAFKANPFPFFARLRLSQPVYRTTLPDKTQIWLLTRYEDVNHLLKDARFAKDPRNALTPEQLRKRPW